MHEWSPMRFYCRNSVMEVLASNIFGVEDVQPDPPPRVIGHTSCGGSGLYYPVYSAVTCNCVQSTTVQCVLLPTCFT